MKIGSYLGNKILSSNNSEYNTDTYVLAEISDGKFNSINSIQNENKIKKKKIINQNFEKDLKIKENNTSIKNHPLTENNKIIKSNINKNNEKNQQLVFIDEKLKSFGEFNTLKNENEYILKNDSDNQNYIYTNNIYNTEIKKMNPDSSKKYHQKILSSKKEIINQINALKYPKERNNMTSLNNDNNILRNKPKVKQVIKPNIYIDKNMNYNIDKVIKSIKNNNSKNSFKNKAINNNFINNKNSSSFSSNKNYKNKIYTKFVDAEKKGDLNIDFSINNKIDSSTIKKDELIIDNYRNTNENKNINIKDTESSYSETISIANGFIKKLKSNSNISINHLNKGIYISKINKSIEELNSINNKLKIDNIRLNSIIPQYNFTDYNNSYDNKNIILKNFIHNNKNNTKILNFANINYILDYKKYNKKLGIIEDKKIKIFYNNNDANGNKITQRIINNEKEKKIQNKMVSIPNNNLKDLIDNINKSLYDYNIIHNKTLSGNDIQQVHNFIKKNKKGINNDKKS